MRSYGALVKISVRVEEGEEPIVGIDRVLSVPFEVEDIWDEVNGVDAIPTLLERYTPHIEGYADAIARAIEAAALQYPNDTDDLHLTKIEVDGQYATIEIGVSNKYDFVFQTQVTPS